MSTTKLLRETEAEKYKLLSLVCKMAIALELPACVIERDGVYSIYMELPTGQIMFILPESFVPLFQFLEQEGKHGNTNALPQESKVWERIEKISVGDLRLR